MKISELTIGQGNVDVEGTIKEVGEIRTFNKFGRQLSVGNAILEDESGTVKLTLWNDDAERFKEGDKVKITNGYVNEFQGEKQLTSGKFGKIEKLGGNGESKEASSKSTSETESTQTSSESTPESEDSENKPKKETAPAQETPEEQKDSTEF